MVQSHLRPYELFFEHRPHYLYAFVTSQENTFEISKGYWVEMLSMMHRRRYKRVLLEKDIAKRLHAHEVFELVSELAHSGCKNIKFAVLDRYYDAKECEFQQMVATNRGIQLKISDDQFELEDWLLDGSSVAPNPRAFPHAPAKAVHHGTHP